MTENTGPRPEAWLLASVDRRRRDQSPDPMRPDRVRAEGRRRRRAAMEQQAGSVRGDSRLHRAARGLGGGLARESGAAMDRRAVRSLVDRSRWTARASNRVPASSRWARIRAARHGRTQRPPLRDDRRHAGRADDGPAARSADPQPLPLQVIDGRVRDPRPALPGLCVAECAAGEARRGIRLAGRPGLVRRPGLPAGQRPSERPDHALDP